MAHTPENGRYQRQTSLKELGEQGQTKLSEAKVLVVGAGGLGCPALQYLAGAGIGRIAIIDHDQVSLSNLHRQVLYSTDDIGLSKAGRAADILSGLNPEIDIIAYNLMLSTDNALEIISQFDIILDGTDNFSTRYLINDACVIAGKPLVYGAVLRFEGQLAVFNYTDSEHQTSSNYRDLFPRPPAESEVMNCAEAGVIGVLPGIIGTMMANEAIKIITGLGTPLANRLMTYNSLNNQTYELAISAQSGTAALIPANAEGFRKMDYAWLCSEQTIDQISTARFDELLQDSSVLVIDVRENGETPLVDEFEHIKFPLSGLSNKLPELHADTLVLFCQSGARSLSAAKALLMHYGDSKKIYSLKEGITGWKNKKKNAHV